MEQDLLFAAVFILSFPAFAGATLRAQDAPIQLAVTLPASMPLEAETPLQAQVASLGQPSQLPAMPAPEVKSEVLIAANAAPAQAAQPERAATAKGALDTMDHSISQAENPGQVSKDLQVAYDGGGVAEAPEAPAPEKIENSSDRLSENVIPSHYDVTVTMDPEAGAFHGITRVDVAISQATDRITVHAKELKIAKAYVTVGGRTIQPLKLAEDAKNEMLTLILPRSVPAGQATLTFAFSAPLNQQMQGLYQSTAKVDGKEEKYAFTQMEPTYGRLMMPMFDEPAMKATFDVTAIAPAKLVVLSNMPAESRLVEGDKQIVKFKTTPKMSTYLLYLNAANLKKIGGKAEGVDINVWTLPHQIGQAGFALEAAKQSVKRLNDYFAIPYPLPKMDMIAVPDFQAGAMENWGAISYRDSAVLVDPKLSSLKAYKRVGEVVFHEWVHQWRGNLDTMAWWNDLWLNEAFATWLAYKLLDQWKPKWRMWESFEKGKRSALYIDALKNTRAVQSDVKSSAEIEQMFDPLSYEKGGAVLRMIESYLGENAFRRGMRSHMKAHAYGNSTADDLFGALQKASGQPVSRMAKDWLLQPGYPILTVRENGSRTLNISQKRFGAAQDSDQLWSVPLVIRYKLTGERKVREHRVVLSEREAQIKLPGKGELAWVDVNGGSTGFYRASYQGRLLESAMKAGKDLSPVERSGVLNDLWAIVRYNGDTIDRFLTALKAASGDKSQMMVEDLAGYLTRVSDLLPSNPKERVAYHEWANQLLAPHYKRLGWEPRKGESEEIKASRAAVLGAMAQLDPSPAFVAEARKRAEKYIKNPASLDPSVVGAVLVGAAKSGDPKLFEAYRQAMKDAKTPEQRNRFLGALTEFPSAADGKRLLEMTLSQDIRPQDAWGPYGAIFGDPQRQSVAWDFLKANWPQIRKRFSDRDAGRIMDDLGSLQGRPWIAEVKAFFEAPENMVAQGARALQQSLETIELNARFTDKQRPSFESWLSQQQAAAKK